MKWISVKDRLPEPYKEVLIYIEDKETRDMVIGHYDPADPNDPWYNSCAEFIVNSRNIQLWAELPWPDQIFT